MAKPVKASNGTVAASNAVLVVPSCWTIAIQVNRLRSSNRLSRWRWTPVGFVTPHVSCMSVPTRS